MNLQSSVIGLGSAGYISSYITPPQTSRIIAVGQTSNTVLGQANPLGTRIFSDNNEAWQNSGITGVSGFNSGGTTIAYGANFYVAGGNNLITFKTGLMFKTPENLTLMVYPIPNYFIDGAEPLSVFLNTSFLKGDLHPSWKITKANEIITVKAGTPVIAVMPINLEHLQGSKILIKNGLTMEMSEIQNDPDYTKYVMEKQQAGVWSNMYRNAVDHLGRSLGKHQVKKILLYTEEVE
jgi:hypothetical protein